MSTQPNTSSAPFKDSFLGVMSRGDKNPRVAALQRLLQSQGFYEYRVDGNFGPITEEALRAFQTTHVGPDRNFLKSTGVLDKATWWALNNPSGTMQRSNLNPRIPVGLEGERLKLVELALQEHAAGVREDPDGSNWGDGVKKYLEGVGPAYWCAYFVSWLYKQVTGKWPYGKRIGAVREFWAEALKAGTAITLESGVLPEPGDLGVYLYTNSKGQRTGLGHIFVVTSVSPDGKRNNSVGGNEGNRVKYGVRSRRELNLVGYIRLFPALSKPAQRLLVTADAVLSNASGTR